MLVVATMFDQPVMISHAQGFHALPHSLCRSVSACSRNSNLFKVIAKGSFWSTSRITSEAIGVVSSHLQTAGRSDELFGKNATIARKAAGQLGASGNEWLPIHQDWTETSLGF